jgi:8-oxo-dGTP pyrophosphatase MutT (NUDIX family)
MTADEPLYRRDPDAWQEHLAEGNAKQARKRVGADAILRDGQGRILLVDPDYKPDWDLPGGMIEANEPPLDGLLRELNEELSLQLAPHHLTLSCIDWVSPHGPWDDSLMLIFDAGRLDDTQISRLQPDHDELKRYAFLNPDEAAHRLRPYVWLRLEAAMKAADSHTVAYLHDGVPASPMPSDGPTNSRPDSATTHGGAQAGRSEPASTPGTSPLTTNTTSTTSSTPTRLG